MHPLSNRTLNPGSFAEGETGEVGDAVDKCGEEDAGVAGEEGHGADREYLGEAYRRIDAGGQRTEIFAQRGRKGKEQEIMDEIYLEVYRPRVVRHFLNGTSRGILRSDA